MRQLTKPVPHNALMGLAIKPAPEASLLFCTSASDVAEKKRAQWSSRDGAGGNGGTHEWGGMANESM